MTCEYSDIDVYDALYKLARRYKGGIEALAKRMEANPQVLRSKLRRSVSTHEPNLDEFSTIIDYSQDTNVPDWHRPLRALNYRHGFICTPLPEARFKSDEDLIAMVCHAFKEQGDLADKISRAISDHTIDDKELQGIEQEFEEVFSAFVLLREKVREKARAK